VDKTVDHRALFDASPIPHFIVNVAGADSYQLAEANRHALTFFKRPHENLIGQNLEDFLDKDMLDSFRQGFEKALKDGKPVTVRAATGLPGGMKLSGFWINPLHGENGAIEILDVMAMPASAEAISLQRERDDAISLLTSTALSGFTAGTGMS